MGIGLIFAGFLFLINPDFITLDLFPDLFGWLLIAKGLKKLSFLEDRLDVSRRFAYWMALAGFAKVIANLFVFTTNVESNRMMISFAFAAVELWLAWIMVSNLFNGIQYLAIRRDGDLALKNFEVVKSYVCIFTVLKYVVNFLPQIATVIFPHVDDEPDKVDNFAQMLRSYRLTRNVLLVIGSILLLFFGIYVARIILAYIRRIRSDRDFFLRLEEDYAAKVTNNESMQKRLAVRRAFFSFFLAALCLIDFYVDDVCLVPQMLLFLFVRSGLRAVAPYVSVPRFASPLMLVFTGISSVSWGFRLLSLFMMDHFRTGFPLTMWSAVWGILAKAGAFAAMLLVFLAVSRIASAFTSEYAYRRYGILLGISALAVCITGFYQYRYVGQSDIVPAVQWAFLILLFYFHKKTMDEIRGEVEWKLM